MRSENRTRLQFANATLDAGDTVRLLIAEPGYRAANLISSPALEDTRHSVLTRVSLSSRSSVIER